MRRGLGLFLEIEILNFQDSYNFVSVTPKWCDEVMVAEISVISSKIRNQDFR